MDYLQPPGFLGTGASLLADLTLVAYILLIVPGMIAGYIYARRNMHRPHHKNLMIIITAVNWVLIIFLMIAAYRFDVAGNIGSEPGNPRYLMPTIHAVLGLPAQLLATYIVYRMLVEDAQVARARARGETKEQLQRYWFKNAKPLMRITLLLWLATTVLGVFNYIIRYNVLPSFGTTSAAPALTQEPLATEVPGATDEPALVAEPATTPEPAVTEEADDDDSGQGRGRGRGGDNEDDESGQGRGRGRGGDDDEDEDDD